MLAVAASSAGGIIASPLRDTQTVGLPAPPAPKSQNLCGCGQLEVASAACGTDDFAAPPLEAALTGPELFGQSWESLPDVPAVCEFVPGYEASSWHGLPKATPAEIIDRLNNQINVALADPIMKALFAELGGIMLGGSPIDFGKLIAKETEKWANVIRAANIKAE